MSTLVQEINKKTLTHVEKFYTEKCIFLPRGICSNIRTRNCLHYFYIISSTMYYLYTNEETLFIIRVNIKLCMELRLAGSIPKNNERIVSYTYKWNLFINIIRIIKKN